MLIIACIFTLNSCKKKVSGCIFPNSINYNSAATEDDGSCISIGNSYEGGILAYILKRGDPGYDPNVKHGLIAAPNDQSTYILWDNDSTIINTGATSSAIDEGGANTDSIVKYQGTGNYAAKICSDLIIGGYSDWCLPSKDELNKLYLSKKDIGGFDNATYWSSTEILGNYAWIQDFSSGNQSYVIKWGVPSQPANFYVRAIRYF
jgi:hypothetical protein